MSDKNRYLSQQAAVYQSPIAFTSTTGAADANAAMTTVRANLDKVIDEISYEGTDGTHSRFFLDEMSPQARITLYKIFTDLKAASPNP